MQYFEEYNATLNSIEPFPKPKVIQPKPIHVKIEKKLFDYGFARWKLFFTCIACDLNSIFRPDFCPIYFDGDHLSGHGNRVLYPSFLSLLDSVEITSKTVLRLGSEDSP